MSNRVLIAEDDASNLEFLVQAVRDADTDVVAVSSGAELIAAMANGDFDLVISDLMMPWMNGATVLRTMRSAGINTPFVVVTGMDPASIERLLHQLDRVTVLRKPVSLSELRGIVSTLLADMRCVPPPPL